MRLMVWRSVCLSKSHACTQAIGEVGIIDNREIRALAAAHRVR
jgi:hypothetical protein